ncbi:MULTISPECIES: acyltransferase domain-containing protein [unclassified Streptomyces]|uniref:acyltransferase domain-containing protein n=1 Tax=Streptomyces sp. NPDC127129 TaxID=3345373 RepID=UPI003644697C
MGNSLSLPVGPVMSDHSSEGWWFYTVAYLAATPHVREFHPSIEVSDETSAASLGVLGEKIALYRTASGHGGLVLHDFVMGVFCGRIHRLEQLDCVAWSDGVDVYVPHTVRPLTTVPDQAWADRVHEILWRLPREYGGGRQLGTGRIHHQRRQLAARPGPERLPARGPRTSPLHRPARIFQASTGPRPRPGPVRPHRGRP